MFLKVGTLVCLLLGTFIWAINIELSLYVHKIFLHFFGLLFYRVTWMWHWWQFDHTVVLFTGVQTILRSHMRGLGNKAHIRIYQWNSVLLWENMCWVLRNYMKFGSNIDRLINYNLLDYFEFILLIHNIAPQIHNIWSQVKERVGGLVLGLWTPFIQLFLNSISK